MIWQSGGNTLPSAIVMLVHLVRRQLQVAAHQTSHAPDETRTLHSTTQQISPKSLHSVPLTATPPVLWHRFNVEQTPPIPSQLRIDAGSRSAGGIVICEVRMPAPRAGN